MGKWFETHFYIPKDGEIKEKMLLVRMGTAVGVVALCVFAISITAYAYFSSTVTSEKNTVQTAVFDVDIRVSGGVEVTPGPDRTQQAVLPAGTYEVTVGPAENTTAKTGFCILYAQGSNRRFHTRQFSQGDEGMVFLVTVTEETVAVFQANWGTSAYYGTEHERYITQNGQEVLLNEPATQPPAYDPEDLVLTHGELIFPGVQQNYAEFSWVLYTGEKIPVSEIRFSSDDTEVCTFADGRVTPVGQGQTWVHAEYGGTRKSCQITVDASIQAPCYLSYPQGDVTVTAGNTFVLKLLDGEGNPQDVEWAASDPGYVEIRGNEIQAIAPTKNYILVRTVHEGLVYQCIVRINKA